MVYSTTASHTGSKGPYRRASRIVTPLLPLQMQIEGTALSSGTPICPPTSGIVASSSLTHPIAWPRWTARARPGKPHDRAACSSERSRLLHDSRGVWRKDCLLHTPRSTSAVLVRHSAKPVPPFSFHVPPCVSLSQHCIVVFHRAHRKTETNPPAALNVADRIATFR
jgi:hypothetical protein